MKALTLWQPWASLMAEGVKTIETRSWAAPSALIGERVAVHAAARKPHDMDIVGKFQVDLSSREIFRMSALKPEDWATFKRFAMPLGAVVASGVLRACVPISSYSFVQQSAGRHDALISPDPDGQLRLWKWVEADFNGDVIEDQRPYGDYTPGRYAWLFDEIAPVTERCPWCWGIGLEEGRTQDGAYLGDVACHTCDDRGVCDPVPVRGAQKVWEWRS